MTETIQLSERVAEEVVDTVESQPKSRMDHDDLVAHLIGVDWIINQEDAELAIESALEQEDRLQDDRYEGKDVVERVWY